VAHAVAVLDFGQAVVHLDVLAVGAGSHVAEHQRVSQRLRRPGELLLAVVAAAVVILTIHSRTAQSQRVGVVAGAASLTAELQDLAKSTGVRVQLVSEPGLPQARAALSSGQLGMVVDGTGIILVKNPISASDTSARGALRA
jgi:ABC-type nitrate/sulfonate/bicarbonate transport system substrate-binding protein